MDANKARAWVYANLVPRQHSLEDVARMSDEDVIDLRVASDPDICSDCLEPLSEHCEACEECDCTCECETCGQGDCEGDCQEEDE